MASSRLLPVLAVFHLLGCVGLLVACPFCTMQGQTLTQEVQQAKLVLYGRLVDANEQQDTTDLIVEAVLRDDPVRAGRDRLVLPRFHYLDTQQPQQRFLLFCDVQKDKIDWYRTIPLPANSQVPAYLRGALRVAASPRVERLRYFFDHLDHSESDIANDAYKEFGNTSYQEVRQVAPLLPAHRVAGWLRQNELFRDRFGLYGLLLGHSGDRQYAELFRTLLTDPQVKNLAGSDGLLAGYTLLDPQAGWTFLRQLLHDSTSDFSQRYAALRAVRFLLDYRPDVIVREQLLEGLAELLEQPDMADVVINDLLKRRIWDHASRLLELQSKASHATPTIRSALVEYALTGRTAGGQIRVACDALLSQLRQTVPDIVLTRERQHQREWIGILTATRLVGQVGQPFGFCHAMTATLAQESELEAMSQPVERSAPSAVEISTDASGQRRPEPPFLPTRVEQKISWGAILVVLGFGLGLFLAWRHWRRVN